MPGDDFGTGLQPYQDVMRHFFADEVDYIKIYQKGGTVISYIFYGLKTETDEVTKSVSMSQ